MGNGNFDYKGNKLFLDIDIPQSSEIRQSISANSITDSLARKVGQIYTFCIEDSTDEDYNDFTSTLQLGIKRITPACLY